MDTQDFQLCALTRAVRERWPVVICATSFLFLAPGVAASEQTTAGTTALAVGETIYPLDLSKFDVQGLQGEMDSLARGRCIPAAMVSCGWTVLSLLHLPPGSVTTASATASKVGERKPGQRFSNDVPAGFEQLAAQQQLEVDVHVENLQPFRAGISFNSSSFTFDNPVQVTDTIAALGVGSLAELEPFISADHPVNADDVCINDEGPEDCLTRDPLPYALLPGLSDEHVDLVVHLSRRQVQNEFDDRLPSAQKGLSWQSAVRGTSTALTDQSSATDVQANASLSYGAGGVFASGYRSSINESTRVNELFFSHQFTEHQARIEPLPPGIERFALVHNPIDNELHHRTSTQINVNQRARQTLPIRYRV